MQAVTGTAEEKSALLPQSLMKINCLLWRLHYHVVLWWEGIGRASTS